MIQHSKQTNRPSVAVIGGGYGGLGAAWTLSQEGVDVHVYETLPGPGGLAGTFVLNGTPIERFYHHIFRSDTTFQETVHALGLDEKLQFFPSTNGFWHRGQIYNFSSPIGLLRFAPLSPKERVRFGLWVLAAQRRKSAHDLDALTAKEWVERGAGKKVWKLIWEPLARAKFGADADTISASWLWSKIALRSSSRKGLGKEQLGYLKGGFGVVSEALVAAIQKAGGRMFWGTGVEEISGIEDKVRVVAKGRRVLYDAVISTIAPEIGLKVIKGLNSAEEERLRGVRHQANVCAVLVLKESLSPVYWLSVSDPNFPFVAVIEHTNLVPANWYKDQHVIYLSRYCDAQDPWFLAHERAIAERIPQELQRIFPQFDPATIKAIHVNRARFTQPVTPVGYGSRIPPQRTSIPGLYLATMAQIYPEDRGTNYALKQGIEVANDVSGYLRG